MLQNVGAVALTMTMVMFRVARQAKQLQIFGRKLRALASVLDGPTAKWKWVSSDPDFVNSQLQNGTLSAEGGHHQIIYVQHRMLTSSFNLMQELVGLDPIKTQILPLLEPLTEQKLGSILGEMEEAVDQLKQRHLWSAAESVTLSTLGRKVERYCRYHCESTFATRSALIEIQQTLLKLIFRNLQQEEILPV